VSGTLAPAHECTGSATVRLSIDCLARTCLFAAVSLGYVSRRAGSHTTS
jgi:hypothetical protein